MVRRGRHASSEIGLDRAIDLAGDHIRYGSEDVVLRLIKRPGTIVGTTAVRFA